MRKPRRADCDRIAQHISADADALAKLLEDASEVQWERPSRQAPEEIARSKGAFSDPTSDIALDRRRLRAKKFIGEKIAGWKLSQEDFDEAQKSM